MGNKFGNNMAKEHSPGLMGKSMKGNGKMGNEVIGDEEVIGYEFNNSGKDYAVWKSS